MNYHQKNEIGLRTDILEIIAKAYRHSGLIPKIHKVKKAGDYKSAISSIHEIEREMKSKKRESFRKKLREKFKKGKSIKRKRR